MNFKLFILFAAVSLSVSGGCKKDNDPAPELETDITSLSFDYEGNAAGKSTFTIFSNTDWTLSCDQTWLTPDRKSGSGNAVVAVTLANNLDFSPRTAKITIQTQHQSLTKTVNITQANKNYTLNVTPAELSFDAQGKAVAGGGTFTVTANDSWEIMPKDEKADYSWVDFDKRNGSGEAAVAVSVTVNEQFDDREAVFTVRTGDKSTELTIKQCTGTSNIQPGGLKNWIESRGLVNAERLILTGTMDQRDFSFIKNEMFSIAHLDLSKVTIAAYTDINGGSSYPEHTIPADALESRTSLKSVVLPKNLRSIGRNAFGRTRLEGALTIPDGVVDIGDSAFTECRIKSIDWGSGLESIGVYAFFRNTHLAGELVIPDHVTSIGMRAFSEAGMSSLRIGDGIEIIESETFDFCPNLISLTLGNNLKIIKNRAFRGCPVSGELILPKSLIEIEYSAFAYSRITSVTIPDGVTTLGSGAFHSSGDLTSFTIGKGITYLTGFNSCQNLTTITIPENVTAIGDSAFGGCIGLTSLTIPDHVKSIGKEAFDYCTGLTSLALGKGLESIGEGAFRYCSELTSLVIPDNVQEIGIQAFQGCVKLNALILSASLKTIRHETFAQCMELSSIAIPDNIREIELFAFKECRKLNSIQIGKGLTYLSGFSNCWGLASVDIPDNVTEIGESAFWGCKGLTSIVIPSSVTKIGHSSFGFSGLTGSFVIPETITEIGWHSFLQCNNITDMQFFWTAPIEYPLDTFPDVPFYVPKGSSGAYKNAAGWKEHTIIERP